MEVAIEVEHYATEKISRQYAGARHKYELETIN